MSEFKLVERPNGRGRHHQAVRDAVLATLGTSHAVEVPLNGRSVAVVRQVFSTNLRLNHAGKVRTSRRGEVLLVWLEPKS